MDVTIDDVDHTEVASCSTEVDTKLVELPVPAGCPYYCKICGDNATGHHYNVLSCNACKTFYRRTILFGTGNHRPCKMGKRCFKKLPVNTVTCRRCRFQKCVDVGMDPFGIITDTDLHANKLVQKIQLARQGARAVREVSNVPTNTLLVHEDCANSHINYLIYVNAKHDDVRASEYCVRSDSDLSLRDVLEMPSSLGMNYKPMEGWPLNNDPSCHVIQMPLEIYVKHNIPFPRKTQLPKNLKQWLYVDVIYTIDFLKTLDFFRQLSMADQIALAKSVTVLCTHLTQSFYSYANDAKTILFPDGRTPFTRHEQFSKLKRKVHTIENMKEMAFDKAEYALLKAIIACDAATDNLSPDGRTLIAAEKEKYAKCLMSYVLARHGTAKAPGHYAACMALIVTTNEQVKMVCDFDTLLVTLGLKSRSRLASDVHSLL